VSLDAYLIYPSFIKKCEYLLSPDVKDRVRWDIDQSGQFSVHSSYEYLLSRNANLANVENVTEVLDLFYGQMTFLLK
jgi:hypothetical protein